MAAAAKVLVSGRNKYIINITGQWSVADETDTVVVDKSTLTGPKGVEPGSIRVDEITWTIAGSLEQVILEWDHAADDMIEILSGQGYMDYRPYGGKNDPRSAGGTGDIVLTTVGGAANDAYSILLHCTLKG